MLHILLFCVFCAILLFLSNLVLFLSFVVCCICWYFLCSKCSCARQPLDRDPPLGRARWEFEVVASDGQFESSTVVVVNVKDVNDNGPFFPEKLVQAFVGENRPKGMTRMSVTAPGYVWPKRAQRVQSMTQTSKTASVYDPNGHNRPKSMTKLPITPRDMTKMRTTGPKVWVQNGLGVWPKRAKQAQDRTKMRIISQRIWPRRA